MEKLEASQIEAIKKMSSIRLSVKLLDAGFEESQIQAMDRGEMMAAWAEVVAAGKNKPITTGVVGYDPELERRRLEFEMRKYEDEQKMREKADELKVHELKLKERELQILVDRERMSKSLVSKTKVYADALKGTLARMPEDVVHLLTYFKDVERQ